MRFLKKKKTHRIIHIFIFLSMWVVIQRHLNTFEKQQICTLIWDFSRLYFYSMWRWSPRFMRADMLISHDQLGHAIDQFGQLLGTI